MMKRTWPLLLVLCACGREVPRAELAARRASRAAARSADVQPADTSRFVAQQAGGPTATVSAVMQLRVAARDGEVTIENEAGQQAMAGSLGSERREEIPGSRAASEDQPGAGWRAAVSVPVLQGERYLLELAPSAARQDSISVELSADGTPLAAFPVPATGGPEEPALFELLVQPRGVRVSPQIERIDIVPSCGTTHVVRSGGRADLYAQYEVIETRETGDIHLPPRADDAQYRAVTFRSRTRGGIRISYLGRELATAARPEACPEL